MTGLLLLLFFGAAAYGAIRLWQQHQRRAPVRKLEEHREDLKDLAEQADLEEEIDEQTDALRERGVEVDLDENDHDENH